MRESLLIELVELDLDAWIAQLRLDIETDRYNPAPAVICDVPKGRGEVRPGAVLSIEDRVVYAAAVGVCVASIKEAVGGPPFIDFSYVLPDGPRHDEWFVSRFGGWEKFREVSLERIDDGASYVVITDVAAFYENIDTPILMSDLRQLRVNEEIVRLLSRCLNRWSQVPGRGLPQGHSPSDVLAKLYLNPIDVNLQALGFQHYRYVDDIRIFCSGRAEAKSAVVAPSRLLRARGLSIQSAKLEILRSDVARRRIEGIAPVIKNTSKRFVKGIFAFLEIPGTAYAAVWKAEELMALSPDDAPMEIVHEAFKTYFTDATGDRFNGTLFRFLLNRLRKQNDDYASAYCVKALETHLRSQSQSWSTGGTQVQLRRSRRKSLRF